MFKKSEPGLSKPGSPSSLGAGAPSMSLGAGAPSIGVARGSQRNAPSVIGPDLTITGELISKGEVQIDGEVQGNIRGARVVVGEHARTAGDLVAEEIIIRGHVMGVVRGMVVTLQSTSHVEGDIFHKALAIEHGASFEGKSRRVDDPLADAPKPDIPFNSSGNPGS